VEGAGTCFFSTESLAEIAPLANEEAPASCARCRQAIEAGSLAVSCPSCKLHYHQSGELPCWTYAERCAQCDQPTDLECGLRWSPEVL
jgi:hypothetical protein